MNSTLQMKRTAFAAVLLLFFGLNVNAQVGVGTSNPDNSAMLDVTSTNKGFLAPRLSSLQRTAIISPATGLMVYDKDSSCFFYYNGNL